MPKRKLLLRCSMTQLRRSALCVGVLALLVLPLGAESHLFNAHDLVTMERVSDPRPSPDGRWVAFTLRSTDLEADRGRTDLWLVPADGSASPRRMTSDPAGDSSPRWAPDGSGLYFVSSRSGSRQRRRAPPPDGEQSVGYPACVLSRRQDVGVLGHEAVGL